MQLLQKAKLLGTSTPMASPSGSKSGKSDEDLPKSAKIKKKKRDAEGSLLSTKKCMSKQIFLFQLFLKT